MIYFPALLCICTGKCCVIINMYCRAIYVFFNCRKSNQSCIYTQKMEPNDTSRYSTCAKKCLV